MVGVRTEAHIFRSQVGIGSESDCLLGQLKRILDISDCMPERRKTGRFSWRGGSRWVWGWSRSIAGERDMKFGNFVCEEVSEAVSERRAWLEVGNGEEDLRWSRLLTVFHRRFGLSETEETKLVSLPTWSLRRDQVGNERVTTVKVSAQYNSVTSLIGLQLYYSVQVMS